MSELEFEHVADLVPDDAVPLWSVRVVVYMRPDGNDELREVAIGGSPRVAPVIGHLEELKHQMLTDPDDWEER